MTKDAESSEIAVARNCRLHRFRSMTNDAQSNEIAVARNEVDAVTLQTIHDATSHHV